MDRPHARRAVVRPLHPAPRQAVVPAPRRGVLGGLVVVATGVPFLLQGFGVPNAPSYLFLAMGLAYAAAYLWGGRQRLYVIPMVMLSSFGIALLLPTWVLLRPRTEFPAFIGIIALGLMTAFVVAPERRWPLVPAGVLGAVAAIDLLTGLSPLPVALQPFFVPGMLVAIGLYLLVER